MCPAGLALSVCPVCELHASVSPRAPCVWRGCSCLSLSAGTGWAALKALESLVEVPVDSLLSPWPSGAQRSGLYCRAPPGSGAPRPWLTWSRGWQLDQDLLGVPRRIHHTQVQEAQEGLRCNAGHVKPVRPGPKGGHEGGCQGRGLQPSRPTQACWGPPQPPRPPTPPTWTPSAWPPRGT